MTANYLLIIAIGLFLIVTGIIYLIQLKGKSETTKRDKLVSLILIAIGVMVVIYPVYQILAFNNSSKSNNKPSNLLGPDYYNRPVQQDHSGYKKASVLYRKAVGNWNLEKSGFDSKEDNHEFGWNMNKK